MITKHVRQFTEHDGTEYGFIIKMPWTREVWAPAIDGLRPMHPAFFFIWERIRYVKIGFWLRFGFLYVE